MWTLTRWRAFLSVDRVASSNVISCSTLPDQCKKVDAILLLLESHATTIALRSTFLLLRFSRVILLQRSKVNVNLLDLVLVITFSLNLLLLLLSSTLSSQAFQHHPIRSPLHLFSTRFITTSLLLTSSVELFISIIPLVLLSLSLRFTIRVNISRPLLTCSSLCSSHSVSAFHICRHHLKLSTFQTRILRSTVDRTNLLLSANPIHVRTHFTNKFFLILIVTRLTIVLLLLLSLVSLLHSNSAQRRQALLHCTTTCLVLFSLTSSASHHLHHLNQPVSIILLLF